MSQQKLLIAEWRKLIMANYETDPGILKKYLPAGTELDEWENKYYTSLVGFMVLKTRLYGFRIPFHSNFPEVNLRFYVRYRSGKEWKRGVVFINEFVPKHAITFVANKLYKERFATCSMKHKYEIDNKLKVGYYWKKDHKWNKLEVTADPNFCELKQGSKEEFIIERYWGYSSIDKNKTEEFRVEHPQWNIYPIEQYTIDCNFKTLYGNDFGHLDRTAPASVFLADGSPAAIFTKKILSVVS
ncbi:MAG TPA: DUF2071 domain-containing protein [Chitinophagaceae bacterium]|nr:DUF2071 domain-containing protein [Chitinophagaceae bacterium]